MSDDQTPDTLEEETDPWPEHTVEQLGEMSDIDRAKLGKDAWNKWARANMKEYDEEGNVVKEGAEVDFARNHFLNHPISFEGFWFPGNINFLGSTFNIIANFENAQFFGFTDFTNTNFNQNAKFNLAIFHGEGNFWEAHFKQGSDFRQVKFKGHANFMNTVFEQEAGFIFSTFSKGVMFQGVLFKKTALFVASEFGKDSNFVNTIFLGTADFRSCKFMDNVNYRRANFKWPTYFSDSTFNGFADFTDISFEERFECNGSFFHKYAKFEGSVFKAPLSFEKTTFLFVPDFRRTIISSHFTFHKIKINFWNHTAPKYKVFKMTEDEDAADKLRRLKELAISAKDHERELSFFSDEIRAKRFHEGGFWKTLTGYFYEWFSFFGRSIFRPSLWLLVIWTGSWSLFLKASESGPAYFWEGMKLSSASIVPFLGASKTALESSKKALFPDDHAGWVDGIMFAEGLLGLIFIFLIGLALRNRFRI